jgi:hypothetical protein
MTEEREDALLEKLAEAGEASGYLGKDEGAALLEYLLREGSE